MELIVLERLFRHDRKATHDIIHSVLQLDENSDESKQAMGLINHAVGASLVWLGRLMPVAYSTKVAVWPDYKADKLLSMIDQTTEKWIAFTALLKDEDGALHPEQFVSYTTTEGRKHSNRIIDIISHVLLHGQHHRAQVAMVLRQAGIAPPSTDLIVNLREDRI